MAQYKKNADGATTFEKEYQFNFLQPITVTDIYHRIETSEPTVEQAAVPEVFEEADEDIVIERSYWGLWALILLAIGAVVIFYNFKDHKLSGSTIGNQHQYTADSAAATYTLPNK